MNETDTPCSDCGTDLEGRAVHVRDLPISTDSGLHVDVAACPTCEARSSRDETLPGLGEQSTRSPSRGES